MPDLVEAVREKKGSRCLEDSKALQSWLAKFGDSNSLDFLILIKESLGDSKQRLDKWLGLDDDLSNLA